MRPSLRTPFGVWAATAVFSLSCGSSSGPGGQPVTSQAVNAALGGQATANGGRVKLSIPAGALRTNTTITIGQTPSPASGALGPVYEIGPTGTTFTQPVSISLKFTSADLGGADPRTLHVATLSKGAWVPIVSTVTLVNSIVSAQITHLSPWTLISYDAVVPPEPPVGGSGGNDGGAAGETGGAGADGGGAGSGGGGGTDASADGGGGTDAGAGGAGGKAGAGGQSGVAGAGGQSGGGGAGATGGTGGQSGGGGSGGSGGVSGTAGSGGAGGDDAGAAGAGGAGGDVGTAGDTGAGGAGGSGGDDAGTPADAPDDSTSFA